jgi:hypothetical protein
VQAFIASMFSPDRNRDAVAASLYAEEGAFFPGFDFADALTKRVNVKGDGLCFYHVIAFLYTTLVDSERVALKVREFLLQMLRLPFAKALYISYDQRSFDDESKWDEILALMEHPEYSNSEGGEASVVPPPTILTDDRFRISLVYASSPLFTYGSH